MLAFLPTPLCYHGVCPRDVEGHDPFVLPRHEKEGEDKCGKFDRTIPMKRGLQARIGQH